MHNVSLAAVTLTSMGVSDCYGLQPEYPSVYSLNNNTTWCISLPVYMIIITGTLRKIQKDISEIDI